MLSPRKMTIDDLWALNEIGSGAHSDDLACWFCVIAFFITQAPQFDERMHG